MTLAQFCLAIAMLLSLFSGGNNRVNRRTKMDCIPPSKICVGMTYQEIVTAIGSPNLIYRQGHLAVWFGPDVDLHIFLDDRLIARKIVAVPPLSQRFSDRWSIAHNTAC